jgi:hypothetical protein
VTLPERLDEIELTDVSRSEAELVFGCPVANGDRLHVGVRIDCGLQQRAVELERPVPSLVVASGKTTTTSPRASASTVWRLTVCVSRRRSRSMKSVPTLAMRRPTTGSRFRSALATKRAGLERQQDEDVEPRNMVRHDQHIAGIPCSRCKSTRASTPSIPRN